MKDRTHDYAAIQEAVAHVRARDARRPDVALVLGSGLGAFADRLDDKTVLSYGDIPHFPVSGVSGHAGQLVIGTSGGRTVVAMQGRVHRYEGWPIEAVVFPVRVMRFLGARALVLTNAAGSLHAGLTPGQLMLISDHINLSGANPLTGDNDDRLGPRFPDMSHAYTPALRAAVKEVAGKQGLPLAEGIYVGLSGPSYETPAEIRMLHSLGGDAVGMSTVPEAIAAAHTGLKVCGISCITNLGAGIGDQPLSHVDVEETAAKARDAFCALLEAAIPAFPLD